MKEMTIRSRRMSSRNIIMHSSLRVESARLDHSDLSTAFDAASSPWVESAQAGSFLLYSFGIRFFYGVVCTRLGTF